jgi:protein-tyrosine phosphatase
MVAHPMTFRFDMLEPGLALSGTPGVASPWWRDFDAVVNVCDRSTPDYLSALTQSFRVVWRPFEDSLPAPIALVRAAALELADCRTRGLNTLVHCHMGQSRSPTIIALFWMGRDALRWEEALRRMRAVRARVDPHPLLLSERWRSRIAEEIRLFLSGQTSLLEQACAGADALVSAHRQRDLSPAVSGPGWDEIEPGLACGARWCIAATEQSGTFELVLDLTGKQDTPHRAGASVQIIGCELRQEGPLDPAARQAVVDLLRQWRQQGRSVLVCCEDGQSLSPLVVALSLMADRSWDFAGAMWYIRQRRYGAWPRLQSLQGLVIP